MDRVFLFFLISNKPVRYELPNPTGHLYKNRLFSVFLFHRIAQALLTSETQRFTRPK